MKLIGAAGTSCRRTRGAYSVAIQAGSGANSLPAPMLSGSTLFFPLADTSPRRAVANKKQPRQCGAVFPVHPGLPQERYSQAAVKPPRGSAASPQPSARCAEFGRSPNDCPDSRPSRGRVPRPQLPAPITQASTSRGSVKTCRGNAQKKVLSSSKGAFYAAAFAWTFSNIMRPPRKSATIVSFAEKRPSRIALDSGFSISD